MRWLQISLLVGTLHGATLRESLEGLKEEPYGFAFVDVGITEEDLAYFRSLDIQKERSYHQFGEPDEVQEKVAEFFCELGSNSKESALQAAALIAQIAKKVVEASGKESAWIHLRASPPTDKFDLPRWHTDGYYYIPEGPDDLLFKFAMTLKGPPTLFYQLPQDLRSVAVRHMRNRKYMKAFCLDENIIMPRLGEGAVFIGGLNNGVAAMHSEPPIHENRLFFSVVPYTEKHRSEIKARVATAYSKDSKSSTAKKQ